MHTALVGNEAGLEWYLPFDARSAVDVVTGCQMVAEGAEVDLLGGQPPSDPDTGLPFQALTFGDSQYVVADCMLGEHAGGFTAEVCCAMALCSHFSLLADVVQT
jgi:hypothetical protein